MSAFAHGLRWWQARERRERAMLGVMVAAVLGFAAWYGVAMPLQRAQQRAGDQLREATADLAEVRAAVDRIRELQAARPSPDPQAVARQILDSAAAGSVPVSRQRVDDAGRLTVGIDAVAAPTLFAWLDTLHATHGTAPSALDIGKQGGTLRVEAVFDTASP